MIRLLVWTPPPGLLSARRAVCAAAMGRRRAAVSIILGRCRKAIDEINIVVQLCMQSISRLERKAIAYLYSTYS